MIKNESANPFGTFKDRRSELILKKALRKRVDVLAIITVGNGGTASRGSPKERA